MMKSRRMKWVWHVACIGKREIAQKAFVRKHEGKRPLGRPKSEWECDIKIELNKIEWGAMDWIHLTQDRDQ